MTLIARLLNKIVDVVPEGAVRPGEHESTHKPRGVWKYTIADHTDGQPYLTRVLFPRVFGFRPMLHKFHRADSDRDLHNHPWKWALSLILSGSYDESRLDHDASRLAGRPVEAETRRVRWWNWLTDQDFHRISQLHGEVFTLFVIGPRIQSWGFLGEDGTVTDWQAYFAAKKAIARVAAAGDALCDVLLKHFNLVSAGDKAGDEVMDAVLRHFTLKT